MVSQLHELVAWRIVADVLMSDNPEETGREISAMLRSIDGNDFAPESSVHSSGLPRLVFTRSAVVSRSLGNVGQNWRRAVG